MLNQNINKSVYIERLALNEKNIENNNNVNNTKTMQYFSLMPLYVRLVKVVVFKKSPTAAIVITSRQAEFTFFDQFLTTTATNGSGKTYLCDLWFRFQGNVNIIAPLKRPRSSMVPIIVVDEQGNVKLVTGAAGGTKILTSVAQVSGAEIYT